MTTLIEILDGAKNLAREGKFDEAIEAYTSGIRRERVESDGSMMAALCNGRGVIHRMKRDYALAWNDYFDALASSKHVDDDEQSALSWVNIADLNRIWYGDFAEAHSRLDEALALVPYGSLVDAQARDQRGLVFVGQKEFNCALAAYDGARSVAEELFEKTPDDEDVQGLLGRILQHTGAAYVYAEDTGKFDEACASQERALELFEKLGDGVGIANTVATMGHLALAAGRYDEVVEIGERAWGIVKEMDYRRGMRTVALNLAEAHLQQTETIKVVPYLEALEADIDSLGDNDAGLMEAQFKRICDLYGGHTFQAGIFDKVYERFS